MRRQHSSFSFIHFARAALIASDTSACATVCQTCGCTFVHIFLFLFSFKKKKKKEKKRRATRPKPLKSTKFACSKFKNKLCTQNIFGARAQRVKRKSLHKCCQHISLFDLCRPSFCVATQYSRHLFVQLEDVHKIETFVFLRCLQNQMHRVNKLSWVRRLATGARFAKWHPSKCTFFAFN